MSSFELLIEGYLRRTHDNRRRIIIRNINEIEYMLKLYKRLHKKCGYDVVSLTERLLFFAIVIVVVASALLLTAPSPSLLELSLDPATPTIPTPNPSLHARSLLCSCLVNASVRSRVLSSLSR